MRYYKHLSRLFGPAVNTVLLATLSTLCFFFFFLIYRYNYLTVTKNNEYVSQLQVEHMHEKKIWLERKSTLDPFAILIQMNALPLSCQSVS